MYCNFFYVNDSNNNIPVEANNNGIIIRQNIPDTIRTQGLWKNILVAVVHSTRPKFIGAVALSSPRTVNTKEYFLNLCHECILLSADIPFL